MTSNSTSSQTSIRRALLSSSCMATLAIHLALQAVPASAEPINNCLNQNPCQNIYVGATGSDAPGSGQPGGPGEDINDFGFTYLNPIQWWDSDVNSPFLIHLWGGEGARGADGHDQGIFGGQSGGNGGRGGNAGNIDINLSTEVQGLVTGTSTALQLITVGGQGGGGAYGFNAGPGTSGQGGDSGHIHGTVAGTFPWEDKPADAPYARAILIQSQGGAGGDGRGWSAGQDPNGPDGGKGGDSGDINLHLNGTFIGMSGGVVIYSRGGDGGKGGGGEAGDGSQGGAGGQAGNGNSVYVEVEDGTTMQTFQSGDAGLRVLSQGGDGGTGGEHSGSGGKGGIGGNADDVVVVLHGGTIENVAGYLSPGLLVQSLGGNGGNGGSASHFVVGPNGGSGAQGGSAGSVSVQMADGASRATIHSGDGAVNNDDFNLAPAILAQSIGGGGGAGSDENGWFAVGGSGGDGGSSGPVAGDAVKVDVLADIRTYGYNSDGIAAQSIGGGGGKGGDAKGTGTEVQMTIGGTGGGGGDGGAAAARLRAGSVIETNNVHSHGILIQSIGGGGGMGGAAYSTSYNAFYGAAIAVGGNGGAGGDGSTVGLVDGTNATNEARITTLGADSYGIIGQSVGGGGGIGGASTATSKTYAPSDYGGLSLSMAMGGKGGTGGSASDVTLLNSGFISTIGAGSVGILGQSVGGGGGAGGDASSSATASGGQLNFSATAAFGGRGGGGGAGGTAEITNTGLILTTGESADGMLVQSIGGGGGIGGAGDAKGSANGKQLSLTLSMGAGGPGDKGGDGYSTTATNSGSIITLGDSAFGIGAQSIGGGGGRAGGGAASAQGDITMDLSIGGNGGEGGSTSHNDSNHNQQTFTTVNNKAGSSIVTFGGDANGIIAQSIGGGGGAAGKAGTSLGTKKSTGDGGNGDAQGTQNSFAIMASGFDSNGIGGLAAYAGLNGAVNALHSLLNTGSNVGAVADDDPADDLDDLSQSKGETDDDNDSTKIHLSVALGGTGGAGGSAGAVVVNNDGEIATLGHHADAILAQAIGGGGGKGGAASTATTDDGKASGAVSVGGSGGASGYGGQVTVVHTGTIYTKGALSAGIVAESIAGGGGVGGASAATVSSANKNSGENTNDGALNSLALSLGGNGGGDQNAEQVKVTSSGLIDTAAHDSIGIVAQSIGGGGGILKTLATNLEGAGGSASAKGTDYTVAFSFGGSAASGGANALGGQVNVTTQKGGAIATTGDNSYGILAQSIGGGGGVQLGGKPLGQTVDDFFGSGSRTGSANHDGSGNSGLYVNVGDDIATKGDGAIGIVAQSIGGGGGLAGHTSASNLLLGFAGLSDRFTGDGGNVQVVVAQGATVGTKGRNAPAMFLQSIGGGGGRITTDAGAYIGTAGGRGQAGTIDVTIDGAVSATGVGSAGIMAQGQGDNSSNAAINITVGSTGLISAGTDSNETGDFGQTAAIYINHGGTGQPLSSDPSTPIVNTVTNNGQILTYGSVRNAVAIYSSAGYTKVFNNAGATLSGDVFLTADGGQGCFTNAGTFNDGNSVLVGACGVTNTGVINVGKTGVVGSTLTIGGPYGGGGKLVFDADFVGGNGDQLVVNGDAQVGDTITVTARSMRRAPLTLVSATGTLTLDPMIKTAASSHLYDYDLQTDGKVLTVTPKALFTRKAASFGANEKSVAGSLQSLFDGGATADKAFTRLLSVADDASYKSALGAISGKVLGSFGSFRFNSSRTFAANLYGGCNELQFQGKSADRCGWARVLGNTTTQKAGADMLGYKADAWAMQMGGQVPFSDTLALTGSLAYENSTFRDGDARIKGDALVAGLGLLYAPERFELSAGIDMAWGWYKSRRTIELGGISEEATAKPEQSQIGGHVRAAYNLLDGGSTFVRPFVEGHAIRVSNKAFTEDGASPFRLAVEKQSDTALIGVAGLEVGTKVALSEKVSLRPFASGAVEFGNSRNWTTTARFAEQPQGDSFDLNTAGPGTLGRFAIGADLIGSSNVAFSIQYAPELGKDFTSHSGMARLTIAF
ncbi:autotransporter outer membrane beta-barrel domain-containing protein [Sandaracinobacter neustonicus]|uniref:Autotransporter outer membrane beta-barrel domain-containing protein n=1 Tax=Sandaracinobacter neustonicus TaxID=1715348 RepID=A0A501XMN0_9SPHN|nr:autotransporter outer membrane beta-barrel domain-containing protein [Sandaracinobacter neustonicus]TPE61931.1 autotransporter outer membrane beta-barrel domain-containing protein [Sandaracinobacter neustonicus]